MADKFGAVSLPAEQPQPGEAVADPLLTNLLSFFRAVLNRNAQEAWGVVAAGEQLVKEIFPHDPDIAEFNTRDLPALFLWRTAGRSDDWIAIDWHVAATTVMALWVFPPAPQSKQALRDPIVNILTKSLAVAIGDNRDPSWVYPGDTDPEAPRFGSLVSEFAGYMSLDAGTWKPRLFIEQIHNEKPKTYPALEMILQVEEKFELDLAAKYDLLAGIKGTVVNGEVPPGVTEEFQS